MTKPPVQEAGNDDLIDPDRESNDGWGDTLPIPYSDDEENTPPPNDKHFEEPETTQEIFLGRGETDDNNSFGTLNEDWWSWANRDVKRHRSKILDLCGASLEAVDSRLGNAFAVLDKTWEFANPLVRPFTRVLYSIWNFEALTGVPVVNLPGPLPVAPASSPQSGGAPNLSIHNLPTTRAARGGRGRKRAGSEARPEAPLHQTPRMQDLTPEFLQSVSSSSSSAGKFFVSGWNKSVLYGRGKPGLRESESAEYGCLESIRELAIPAPGTGGTGGVDDRSLMPVMVTSEFSLRRPRDNRVALF
ncbi:hypothetical protein FB451DRAFT_1172929 [Mycena latifolia]|nr:hypothetical protein FB451DRAFT_1172929 [Mycena latifolia]